MQAKSYMGVDRLIDLSSRYELIVCDRCASGQHKDCLGKNATLTIAGEKIIGQCLCNNDAHNSLLKGKKVPCEMCSGFGRFEVTPEMALGEPELVGQLIICRGCEGKGYTIEEKTDGSQG